MRKNLLVAAIAAFVAQGAFAADVYPELSVAAESQEYVSGEATIVNTNFVSETAPGVLGVSVDLGFSIGNATSKYGLFRLTNATFSGSPEVKPASEAEYATLSAGGDSENYAIFEIAATQPSGLAQDEALTLGFPALTAEEGKDVSVSYTLYGTAQDAVDNIDTGTGGLASSTGVLFSLASAVNGPAFADPTQEIALVASEFKRFGPSDYTADFAEIDASDLIGQYDSDGDGSVDAYRKDSTLAASYTSSALNVSDATITFSGDFSFGVWSYNNLEWYVDENGEMVADSGVTVNDDGTITIDQYQSSKLSVTTGTSDDNADVAIKGSYSAVLSGISFYKTDSASVDSSADPISQEATLGSISYDTTSIEIPYLTTYSEYNQRVYLTNTSSQDASYTTTFLTESGVTVTEGVAATGTIPAGEMIALKAVDIVTLEGKTRTSATIEVEAGVENLSAVTQTVNLNDSSTDTIVLKID